MSTEIKHVFFFHFRSEVGYAIEAMSLRWGSKFAFVGLRRDRVFKAQADDAQLNFPSCSRVESKVINTDTQVKFPYNKCVRIVGRECPYGNVEVSP